VPRLFGTDGIRGVANRDLTPELAMAVGRGLVATLGRGDAPYLIARDTRLSGEMLEAALVAGICAGGGDVDRAGILPTPAMAYLVRQLHRPCGVVLSASHNPIEDNGIKVFGPDGFKLPDEVEDRIEAAAAAGGDRPLGTAIGRAADFENAEELYLDYLMGLGLHPLSGLRVTVDCAYGASYRVAPRLWRALGAEVIPLHDDPDGAKINVACGSTHPRPLVEAVLAHRADVGFAHDGDADRVIAVDERGEVVDGDLIMAIAARDLAAEGRLRGGLVVATVMSNLGLERLLAAQAIRLERARVGDRYVLERMQDLGASLGGEQSGHIIFLEEATTGDGLLTALHLADVMRRSGQPLSALAGGFQRFPQVLHNVVVGDRHRWEADRDVRAAIDDAETRLADQGRLLVRASGTEPLVRVMVEAHDAAEAEAVAAAVAQVIAARYGTATSGAGGADAAGADGADGAGADGADVG
jgi:phosphoglucosamine mutase